MSPKRTIEPFLKIKIKLQWMKEELGQAGGPAEECWGLLTKMECRISFSAPPPPTALSTTISLFYSAAAD